MDNDQGETLLEVLIALVIIGISVTALLAGMATASKAAALHKDHADASTFLLRAADVVKAQAYTRDGCSSSPYQGSVANVTPPSWTSKGGSAPVVSVSYWDPQTKTFTASCPAADNPAWANTQLITLSITSPGNQFDDSISVVKRVLA